ncbi:MAG TPA: hypothetical protein VEX43_18270 [Chthoniobacterales bacterium]|nr:hypothetical protein [Chthoniobacterales bacterium]
MKTVFTQRRKGAKGGIKTQNLCAFAPLRASSAPHSKRRRFFVGHAVGNAFDPILDQVLAEINENSKAFVHQPQVGQNLLAVNRIERSDRFHFHEHAIIDDKVGSKAFVEPESIPRDRNRDLSFHNVAMLAQFVRERDFVNDFKYSGPETGVQAVGRVNDVGGNIIFFHAGKPAPFTSPNEAKNLCAFA